MSEKGPINITIINGCLIGYVPELKRSGEEVMCLQWQNHLDKDQIGEMELDYVDEKKGTASCKYSGCTHCATPDQ